MGKENKFKNKMSGVHCGVKWVNVISCHVINEKWSYEKITAVLSLVLYREKINVPISTTPKKVNKKISPLPGEKID